MGNSAFFRASVVLLVLCAAGATADAAEMYFTPAAVHTDDDKDRGVDDGVAGGQVSLGWVLSDRVSIEGMTGFSNLGGPDDLRIWEGSLNLLVSLSPGSRLSPYLLGGFGMMNTDSNAMDGENSALANAGVGLMYRFGESPVSLRLEYRARFETANTLTFEDRITSLGLQFAFGGKKAPLPAAPVDGDADGDGVADSRDACPNTPRGQAVDARGCPRDSDGDGVTDDRDQCPNTVRGAPVDARGCELDSDKDGVVNRLDECPDTSAGVRVDVKGCEIREVIRLPGVTFETNSDRLLPGAEQVLADAAATLRMNRDLVIEVAGHTDSDGSAEYNEGLSERRAETVRDYLIRLGADSANLTARGYGESQPVADNTTAEGKARNRRVELRILNR
jgi:OmpA-OmpF porin, OOP family